MRFPNLFLPFSVFMGSPFVAILGLSLDIPVILLIFQLSMLSAVYDGKPIKLFGSLTHQLCDTGEAAEPLPLWSSVEWAA